MGTNFYWIKDRIEKSDIADYFKVIIEQDKKYFSKDYCESYIQDYDIYHIGKRSAAGRYCSDCNISSCEAGSTGVHSGLFKQLDVCPVCGKDLKGNYTTSFTWYDYNRDRYLLEHFKNSDVKMIINEYDEEFTVKEFLEKEINDCKIYRFSKMLFS